MLEATGATTGFAVGGRHHHGICGSKYTLDHIVLELISLLQFGNSSSECDSLRVILEELLGTCTDHTLL